MSNKKPTITKSELVYDLAERTNLTKTQVNSVFAALEDIVHKSIQSNKSIVVPGLVKIYVHKKPASSARQMRSPATGEIITVPAKPAHKVVKAKPIKNLKDMI